jgi:PPIC-type PPIASE domain
MRPTPRAIFRLFLAVGLMVGASACSSDKAQPVLAQNFYARHSTAGTPISPLDQPGIIPLPDAHAQAPRARELVAVPTASDLQPPVSTVAAPATIPSTLPDTAFNGSTTQPRTQASLATDQYMTLGSVVLVVNGRPIFANKVLRQDVNVLRSYAQQMDIHRFEDAARSQIERTVEQLKDDELEVAAAERTLDPKDIQLARALTHLWSQNQVAQAGGSEQVVRLRAQASGEDFEEQEDDQYRIYLHGLYYFRKINPQIDITAEDERRYYRAHLDEFTTTSQATIILIEADPAKLDGNIETARTKLQKIREHALAGEDFANFGRQQNDLPGSVGPQGNGGQMTLKPNSFILSNVEAEVWKIPIGQISEIIEDHDAVYLFKLLTRDEGGTKPFSDSAVQEAITKRLTDIQRSERRDAELRKLVMEQIVSPPNLEPVVEMALQNYPKWSKP